MSVRPFNRLSVQPYVRPYISLSIFPSHLGENVIFSAPDKDKCLIFSSFATFVCCHPCLFTVVSLLCYYCLSICLSETLHYLFRDGGQSRV